jgi:hypothetical protein
MIDSGLGWDHLYRILETTIPIIIFFLASRRQAKKEADERAQRVKDDLARERAEQDARHRENQEKLNGILNEQVWLTPHYHNEEEGPLMAKGIRRRPRNGPR